MTQTRSLGTVHPLGLLALLLLAAAPLSAVGFRRAPDTAAIPSILGYRTGDADGDGQDEIAAARDGSPDVAVMWNQGGPLPVFAPATDVPVLVVPRSLAFSDLDGDGRADLAVVGDETEARLVVRRSSGLRSFDPPASYVLPTGPFATYRRIAALDLDGDLRPELVVAGEGYLLVLENRGDGTFLGPEAFAGSLSFVLDMIGAELDTAPGTDLLLVLGEGVQPFFNDGEGRLGAGSELDIGPTFQIEVLDADRDGLEDVVSLYAGAGRVYRNDGRGGFAPASLPFPIPDPFQSSEVDDVNGDGIADLILTDPGFFTIVYGDGALGFGNPRTRAGGPSTNLIVRGDFDGDGDDGDLVLTGGVGIASQWLAASVPLPPAGGPARYAVGNEPRALAAADLDGDGWADLVTADVGSETLTLLGNQGGGSLAPLATIAAGGIPRGLQAADFDGDGRADLLVLIEETSGARAKAAGPAGQLALFRNQGNLVFAPPSRLASGQGPMDLTVGDLDGDGFLDAATADRDSASVTVLRGGAAGFSTAASLAAGQGPTAIAAADLDGDGDLDLATAGGAGEVLIYRNQGSLAFTPLALPLAAGQGPIDLGAVDLDLDGLPELLVLDRPGRTLLVLHNDGGLAFRLDAAWPLDGLPTALARGDLNCDAAADVLVTLEAATADGRDELLLFLGEGTSVLAPPQRLASGMGPSAVLAADLDRVGAEDPVVAEAVDDEVEVRLNAACALASACPLELAPVPACAGAPVRLLAPEGYRRYVWPDGSEASEWWFVPAGPGTWQVRLGAFAEDCVAWGSFELSAAAPPTLRPASSGAYGCAGDDAATTFRLEAGAAPGTQVSWAVDGPGVLETVAGESTVIVFPPDMPEGESTVTVLATGPGGCTSEARLVVGFVADAGQSGADLGNSLLLARGPDGGVWLSWNPARNYVFDVLRGPDPPASGAALTTLAAGVAGSTLFDRPPAGLWFYAVRGASVCAGAANGP